MTDPCDWPPFRASWRIPYLIAAFVSEMVANVFARLIIVDDRGEHWLLAGWWAAAAVGYAILAHRRPLPARMRPIDWIPASIMALYGAVMVMRATLPDAVAFRWALVLMAGYTATMLLMLLVLRRRLRAAS